MVGNIMIVATGDTVGISDLAAKLQEALDHAGNTHSLADVVAAIDRGEAQFWATSSSVLVTEVRDDPRRKTLHAWLAAGEMDSVIELLHEAGDWGRSIGCDRVTLSGRRGWERVAERYGLKTLYTVCGGDL